MGIADDAKETVEAGARKVSRTAEDTVDRAKDKVAEARANKNLATAKAEQDSVEHRNEVKAKLRDH